MIDAGIDDTLPTKVYSGGHLSLALRQLGLPRKVNYHKSSLEWIGSGGKVTIPELAGEFPEFIASDSEFTRVDLSAIPLLNIERPTKIHNASMRALFVYQDIAFTTDGVAVNAVPSGGLPTASISLNDAQTLKNVALLNAEFFASDSHGAVVILAKSEEFELYTSMRKVFSPPEAFGAPVKRYMDSMGSPNLIIYDQREAVRVARTVASLSEYAIEIAQGEADNLVIRGDGIELSVGGEMSAPPVKLTKTSAINWLLHPQGGKLSMSVGQRNMLGFDERGRFVAVSVVYVE